MSSTPGPRLTFLLSSCLPWKPAAGCGLCVYLEVKGSAEVTLLTFWKAFRDLVAVGPSGRLLDSEVVGHFAIEGVRMEGWPLPAGSCSASGVILQALWGVVKHRPDPGALWLPPWPRVCLGLGRSLVIGQALLWGWELCVSSWSWGRALLDHSEGRVGAEVQVSCHIITPLS